MKENTKYFLKKCGAIALVLVCFILSIKGIGALIGHISRPQKFTCTDYYYESRVYTEEYRKVPHGDWNLPAGAEDVTTNYEFREWKEKFDHYEYVTTSGEVVDYEPEFYSEKRTVYKKEPVYDTKYYYTLWEWAPADTVTNIAHDKEVVYANVEETSDYRITGTDVTYYIAGYLNNRPENVKVYTTKDLDFYNDAMPDINYSVKVSFFGDISRVLEDETITAHASEG